MLTTDNLYNDEVKAMNYRIVEYNDNYCKDISNIVIRNLLEVNSKDYGLKKTQEDSLRFTPEMIVEYSKTSNIYVALDNETVVGTLRVDKNIYGGENEYVFLTIFVLPEEHGKGIGRLLIENAEIYVRELGGKSISIPSGITAHGFYNKLDYEYVNGKEPDSNGLIWLKKNIAV